MVDKNSRVTRELREREDLTNSILEEFIRLVRSNRAEGTLFLEKRPHIHDSTHIEILTKREVVIATAYYTGIETDDKDKRKKPAIYISLEENLRFPLSYLEDRKNIDIRYVNVKTYYKETKSRRMHFPNKGVEDRTIRYSGKLGRHKL